MAPITRTLFGVSAVAAMAALTACAPTSEATDPADGPQLAKAAQVQVAATATPTPVPTAAPTPDAPEAPEVPLTTELNGESVPRMGQVVTDQDGYVLYRLDEDTPKPSASTCDGNCARVWPPAYTDGTTKLSGVAKAKVGTLTRADGTEQLTIGGWPVYRYIGDTEPGQWKGQKVDGVWFVVKPDGKKNLSCLPEGTPKAFAPPPLEDAPAGSAEEPAESPDEPAESPDAADDGTGAAGSGFQF